MNNEAWAHIEEWYVVPTKNGAIRVSSKHGKNELQENMEIATYLANKYNYEIDLVARDNTVKTADSFNRTLDITQEYKKNLEPTLSAIDNEIRAASKQARHIVLNITSAISDMNLRKAIKNRVRRSRIETLTIIRHGDDKTYTKHQIINDDWKL